MNRRFPRALAWRTTGAVFAICACAGSTTGVPPAEPTHHAIVEGVVVGADGQRLGSISVGARFAASVLRQASVTGGGTTDAGGAYRFEVWAASRWLEGAGEVTLYVHASRSAPPGGTVVQDSVLATIRMVPLSDPPPVGQVREIQLAAQ